MQTFAIEELTLERLRRLRAEWGEAECALELAALRARGARQRLEEAARTAATSMGLSSVSEVDLGRGVFICQDVPELMPET